MVRTKIKRIAMESQGKMYNVSTMNAGNAEIFARIGKGQRIVKDHNTSHDASNHIRLVMCIAKKRVGM